MQRKIHPRWITAGSRATIRRNSRPPGENFVMNIGNLGGKLQGYYSEAIRIGKAVNDIPGVDQAPNNPDRVHAQFADNSFGSRTTEIVVEPNYVEYLKHYTSIRPQQVAEGSVHQKHESAAFDISGGNLEAVPFEYSNIAAREALDPNNQRPAVDLSNGVGLERVSGTINLITGTITALEER